MQHLTSPSLCHGLPFWGYLLWLWRFFCPPSANLHSKGSVGAAQKGKEKQKWCLGASILWPIRKDRGPPQLLCIPFHLLSHLYLSPTSSFTMPPYGALRQNSRHNQQLTKIPKSQCWQPVPTLALAGSSWKSIAGYCWNNNHSNRSCKYLWESNAALLWQPKLISRRHSCFWSLIPLCFTSKDIFSLICNCMPLSTSISTGGVRKLSNILRLFSGANVHVFHVHQPPPK